MISDQEGAISPTAQDLNGHEMLCCMELALHIRDQPGLSRKRSKENRLLHCDKRKGICIGSGHVGSPSGHTHDRHGVNPYTSPKRVIFAMNGSGRALMPLARQQRWHACDLIPVPPASPEDIAKHRQG